MGYKTTTGTADQSSLYDRKSLCALPQDVLLNILSLLNISDIIACTQVCHLLHRLTREDVSLKYTVELALAGMVDSDTSLMPVCERFNRLQEYTTHFRSGSFSCDMNTSMPGTDPDGATQGYARYCKTSRDGSMYYIDCAGFKGEVYVYSPPSKVRGIPAGFWRVPTSHLEGTVRYVAVEVSQDLVVLFQELGNERGIFDVHFLTLQGAGPHSAATRPVLRIENPLPPDPTHAEGLFHMQIHGNHIAWVRHDGNGISHLEIHDWNAGKLVWRFSTPADSAYNMMLKYTLLDLQHVIIAANTGPSIAMYHYTSDSGIGADSTAKLRPGPLYTLRLPTPDPKLRGPDVYHSMTITDLSSCVPTSPQHAAAPFQLNPESTIVALEMAVMERQAVMLLIPHATFTSLTEATRTGAYALAPLVDGVPDISWNDWGPTGSLMLQLVEEQSSSQVGSSTAYGSRFPMLYLDPPGDEYGDDELPMSGKVVIFELDPWTARHARRTASNCDDVDSQAPEPGPEESDMIAEIVAVPECFLQSDAAADRLPFACTRVVPIEFPLGSRNLDVVMHADGFSIQFARGDEPYAVDAVKHWYI